MLDVLRQLWADTFARDTEAMVDAVLLNRTPFDAAVRARQHEHPDPAISSPIGPGVWNTATAYLREPDGWMYVIDARTDEIEVCEATYHGGWLPYGRWPLFAGADAPDSPLADSSPVEVGLATRWYAVQYQLGDSDDWLDKADGDHPTLAAARGYEPADDIVPLRIVRRTETVIEALPDPREGHHQT